MFLSLYSNQVITGLSVLTVVGQAIIVALLVGLLIEWKTGKRTRLSRWIDKNGLWAMLVVALIATMGSLYMSDINGWTPCKLCWYQRIFMYPQVVILALALIKRDKKIAPYITALCVIGALIAAKHYGNQVWITLNPPVVDPLVPCDTSGVSCASKYVFHFGYITIPMMAFTAFLMNALTSVLLMKKSK